MRTALLDIVDFHSHILPGADHGSSSLDTSVSQLKKAFSKGIKRVIATPHFYPMREDVDAFVSRRRAAYDTLESALTPDLPAVKVGAEVMICNGIDRLPGLEKLFINGTETVLVELPPLEFQTDFANSVYRLTSRGITVILAHPERYERAAVSAMLDSGAQLQCNSTVLAGVGKVRRIWPWIADKNIVAMGSDIHKSAYSVYSDFVKATVRLGDYLDFIKERSDAIWNAAEFGLNN